MRPIRLATLWFVGRHLSLALVVGVLISACAPRVQDTPIDPDSYASAVRIACVGDSITACPDCWPSPLSQFLGDRWELNNFGLGGGCVLSFGDYPYLTLMLPDVLAFQPDVVVILLGTNDSKPRHWYYKKEFEQDYGRLIQAFREMESPPRIWMCLPPPAFPGQWGIDDGRLREMQPVIRNVARKYGIPLVDLYTPLLNHAEWFPDQIHPNEDASDEMARQIFRSLTGTGVPLDATGADARPSSSVTTLGERPSASAEN